ncbi:hypothetical protein EsH8_VIII_000134 [Colletotrichum jinshuiense]
MASRLVFDPLVALRAGPLVSSTCTLLYAWDQHFFLSIFNKDEETRKKSAPLLKSYYTAFFRRGVVIVLGFITVSASTAAMNLYKQSPSDRGRGTFWWYTAGAAFSTGHLLFVPVIAPHVQNLIEAKDGTDVNETLDRWLRVNWWRMVTVDFAAWVAFFAAAVSTLRA